MKFKHTLAEARKLWAAALRSGRYRQTKKVLCKPLPDGSIGHCCLGVACRVYSRCEKRLKTAKNEFGTSFAGSTACLPVDVLTWLGISEEWEFLHMNDREGWSFGELADFVDKPRSLDPDGRSRRSRALSIRRPK